MEYINKHVLCLTLNNVPFRLIKHVKISGKVFNLSFLMDENTISIINYSISTKLINYDNWFIHQKCKSFTASGIKNVKISS